MRLSPLLIAMSMLAPEAALAGPGKQIRLGAYLGITPGARRPVTAGAELAGGVALGNGVTLLSELFVRPELRGGRVPQLGLGIRTGPAHVWTDAGVHNASGGAGVLGGLALRPDGRSGALVGVTAHVGSGWGESFALQLDGVVPFAGPALRIAEARRPAGLADGPNPVSYRRSSEPRTSWLVEPTATLGYGVDMYWRPVFLGRPCRVDGGHELAPLAVIGQSNPKADRWIQRGREEAGSVGAFVQLAADLHSLGAPKRLVAGALAAAEEEVQHALLAYAMAESLAPIRCLPGPCPMPTPMAGNRVERLRHMALESLVDGIRGEGEAASFSARLRDASRDPVEAALEARIAFEEGRHAGLAEAVLLWTKGEGGAQVEAALRAA